MSGTEATLELFIEPTDDPAWLLVEEGFQLAREHEIESLFTVANGYLGTRGALAEGSRFSSPRTFIAGVFDRQPRQGAVPSLVAAPDWIRLAGKIGTQEIRLDEGEIVEHRRVLDLRQGILWREWRHRDTSGRISRIRGLRLASLADRHLLFQSVTFTAENYSGHMIVEACLEQPATTEVAPGLTVPVLVPVPAAAVSKPAGTQSGAVTLLYRTPNTGLIVAFATKSELRIGGPHAIDQKVDAEPGRLIERWALDFEIGETLRLDRLVCVHTSRDGEQPADLATAHLERLLAGGAERAVVAHARAWAERWEASDIEIEGDDDGQRALRFAGYHLIGAANPEDERVSVGARGLTGETYLGHVFWDTEIFLLPFYLCTHPATARALLMYRHHTLAAAREKARALGYRGALYPWESADTGEETTPPFGVIPTGEVIQIRNGELEHHISADVAYAVWQYWNATVDEKFFLEAGAEIMLETARFWASRGRLEEDGAFHIRHVIGPDEYHEDVDDNAYTNLMAQWNLERGVETARLLEQRWPERWRALARSLEIDGGEIQSWERLALAMYTGFDPKTQRFEQFRGYFGLEEIALADSEPSGTAIDLRLGRERVQRAQITKQADVVMAIHLLWDRFPPEVRAANFHYYEPRTAHGSSLSPAIHALVAARLGDLGVAGKYFRQTAEIDLANNMGNAAGGVHMAALGGLWQAAIFGYAGARLGAERLALDPHLAPGWKSLRFPFEWRGRRVRVALSAEPLEIDVRLDGEGTVDITLGDDCHATISSRRPLLAERAESGWRPRTEAPI